MSDELLPYYNDELAFLREMGKEFAVKHPRVAGHLRISEDAFDDPHVARLMQGVAFLNARTARRLDDEFPQLVDTLLDVLYPHYLAPTPSMSTVQFRPGAEMAGPHVIPQNTEIESEPVQGEVCRFRTRYPVTLWPISLQQATILGQPLAAPANPFAEGAPAALHMVLRCTAEGMTFSELQPDKLRFHLRGQASNIYALHELILNNTISVALADKANDPAPVIVPASAISPVGFGPDEGLLPYSPRSQQGYRILTEFFAFPEKFLFFDIDILQKTLQRAGPELHIFLYFNKRNIGLERSVNKDAFALGCTPIINLFEQRAEPILLGRNRLEYRLIPDARRRTALEVHSVRSVTAIDSSAKQAAVRPFYAKRGSHEGETEFFWTATRRPSVGMARSSDVFLSIAGADVVGQGDDWTISVETLCSNGDLPANLPYGGGHPHFALIEGSAAVADVLCISPPTYSIRPRDAEGHRWSLLTHLTLNHLSLTGDKGLDALREILRLYDFRGSAEALRMIEGITALRTRRGSARAPARPGDPAWADALCRGMDIGVEFDPVNFPGNSCYLFAMVLDHFFSLYATINSFTRLTATVRAQPGVLRTWPARAGDRQLL